MDNHSPLQLLHSIALINGATHILISFQTTELDFGGKILGTTVIIGEHALRIL
jgi:hypothetical protein